jgi:hypothetical protein
VKVMDKMDARAYTRAMTERRQMDRQVVDVHLDDLQAEVEFGARTAGKIAKDASTLDRLTLNQLEQAAIAGRLKNQVMVLRESIREQQQTLAQLRAALKALRRPTP